MSKYTIDNQKRIQKMKIELIHEQLMEGLCVQLLSQ